MLPNRRCLAFIGSLVMASLATQALSQTIDRQVLAQRKLAGSCYLVQERFFATVNAARLKIRTASCAVLTSAQSQSAIEKKLDKVFANISKTALALNKADTALVFAVNRIGQQNCDVDYGGWTFEDVTSIADYEDALLFEAVEALDACDAE